MGDVQQLRLEAEPLLESQQWQLRSCHRCNPAHDYLTNSPDGGLVCCFDCGRWYFRGVDITIEPEKIDG